MASRVQLQLDLRGLSKVFGLGDWTYGYWTSGWIITPPHRPQTAMLEIAQLTRLRYLDILLPRPSSQRPYWELQNEIDKQNEALQHEQVMERVKMDARIFPRLRAVANVTTLKEVRILEHVGVETLVVEWAKMARL